MYINNNYTWIYYKTGTAYAKIDFNNNIKVIEKDFLNNKYKNEINFSELDKYTLRSKYMMNLNEVKDILNNYQSCIKSNDLLEITSLYIYKKDIRLNDKYCGINSDLELWSQIKKEPGVIDFITYKEDIIAFICPYGAGTEYLIKEGFEEYTPLVEWTEEIISKTGNGTNKQGEYFVKMSDGTKLATDVWLPAEYNKKEKLPTILIRTCYDKKRSEDNYNIFADRGYAVVLQDVRGREKSEGKFIGMYYERTDGNDTINWIAKQEWSNGNIGMIGGSYLGYVQWAAAASGNKYLKTIVSQVSGGSPFYDIERRGGGYNMGIMQWNIMMSEKQMLQDSDKIDWETELKKRPIKDIPKNITGKNLEFWDLYMEHPNYDDFWREMTFSDEIYNVNVPALVISGWHDGDLNGTIEIWEMLKRNNVKNCKLLLGPWEHAFNNRRFVGEYELSSDSIIYNMDLTYLKWFDKFLKGINNGIENIKNKYYVEGQNEWKYSNEWPPHSLKNITMYLSENDNVGLLLNKETYKKSSKDFSQYIYNPDDPQIQLSDNLTGKSFTPNDYSNLEKRKDILLFTSKEFTRDTIIGGRPKVTLYASSSALDTDWVVRITVVTEEGKSYRITDSLLRAKYRNSFTEPELLEENKVEKYIIKLPYCAQLIKKGERLRLQVTSSQFGEMFPNYNTGNDHANDTECVIATQRIYHNDEYKSYISFGIEEL